MKFLYWCSIAITLAFPSSAQTPPNYRQTVPVQQVYQYAWTKEKWQGADNPYYEIRMRITKYIRAGKSSDALIALYENEYKQKPTDKISLFGWACAIIIPRTMNLQENADLRSLYQAFTKSKPPYTYEFMRMRYLTIEQSENRNDYTTALGERLVEQDKNDLYLLFYAWADICTDVPGAKEKSLGYAHSIIKLAPDRSTGYGCVADTYYKWWAYFGMKPEDARQCIAWNQEYLKREKRVGKSYDRGRESSRSTIEKLQKWLAEHK